MKFLAQRDKLIFHFEQYGAGDRAPEMADLVLNLGFRMPMNADRVSVLCLGSSLTKFAIGTGPYDQTTGKAYEMANELAFQISNDKLDI